MHFSPFAPSERQLRFRSYVYPLIGQGVVRTQQWLFKTADVAFGDSPVTVAEWKQWDSDDEFKEWFIGGLYVEAQTDLERKLLEGLFWTGVSAGMAAGKDWAFRIFKELHFGDDGDSEAEKKKVELDAWLGRAGGSGWKRKPTAQA